ncbi:hypothetical protein L596_016644 [Steinernema carpocapsae]|uniref:Uncharacterized protein n=1 Tax=Steinernema carpocapsae TaxID=34508 RepID=A0A4U5NJI6_STECR|nr:hypothetical protein L596_016644 [Steinernema carpocapsae]
MSCSATETSARSSTPPASTLSRTSKENLKGFNGTIVLPPVQGMIAGIIKGTWKVQVKLVSHGQTIANVKAPSNEEWIQVE